MTDIQNEENKKTIVSFVVGLLIGGLLVWAFSGSSTEAPTATNDNKTVQEVEVDTEENEETSTTETNNAPVATTPTLPVGDGSVTVSDQPASSRIALDSVTFPIAEGWIGVREWRNESLGAILGVVRFSEAQNIVPEVIQLQYSTRAGREYAVVFFTDDGDRVFNSATDVQVPNVYATFTAR